jgi:hypothetical protein
MKTSCAKVLIAVLVSAGVASLAYSQTAPKDILPPTNIAHPPVSPTLNVSTPDNAAVPPVTPTAITPQAPAAPAQSVPQLPTPGVPATGEPVGPGSKQTSLWTQTNAATLSAWGKTATAGSTSPSAAKAAPDLWSKPPPNAHLWNSGTQLGSSGTKTDWK